MFEIKLVNPSLNYAEDIMKYREEFLNNNDSLAGCSSLKDCLTANEYLSKLKMLSNHETCPKNMVPSSTYLAVNISSNKLIGIIELRHHINHPYLSEYGGHIGYSVRPKERKKGYATKILEEILIKCKEQNLKKVLVTCLEDNIASEKVILRNGGIFERLAHHDTQVHKRFWINTIS